MWEIGKFNQTSVLKGFYDPSTKTKENFVFVKDDFNQDFISLKLFGTLSSKDLSPTRGIGVKVTSEEKVNTILFKLTKAM